MHQTGASGITPLAGQAGMAGKTSVGDLNQRVLQAVQREMIVFFLRGGQGSPVDSCTCFKIIQSTDFGERTFQGQAIGRKFGLSNRLLPFFFTGIIRTFPVFQAFPGKINLPDRLQRFRIGGLVKLLQTSMVTVFGEHSSFPLLTG